MKSKLLNLFVVGLICLSFIITGCSDDGTNVLDPNSSTSQEISDPGEQVEENKAPFVKFECSSTSVYPGSSLVVHINAFDIENDELTITSSINDGTLVQLESGVYEWTLPVVLGIYPMNVNVSDGVNITETILQVEVSESPTFGGMN